MAEPFIYVGTMTIKPGKLEEARKRIAELVDFVEINEPRLIAFHCFLDEEGTELTVVQVHPDVASMEFHQEVNAKHFTTAFDYLESSRSDQYYGPISETLAAELAKWDDPNVAVTRMPVHEAGFTRTSVR
jgi:quinol monooxygenase YgiN